MPSGSTAARIAWLAAVAAATLDTTAYLSSSSLRVLAGATGAVLAVALAPAFVRRATPFSAALLTTVVMAFSAWTVTSLSGLPWNTGISWSRAGAAGRPTAWLFSAATLCFALGVLAAGRMIADAGYRRGALEPRHYTFASLLPAISCFGFVMVAFFPVDGAVSASVIHNLASWTAVGAFWAGMVAATRLGSIPRPLRRLSGVAAVVVLGTWLPNGLHFMRYLAERPVTMLAMELTVFPLCLLWFCMLGWEWSRTRAEELQWASQ